METSLLAWEFDGSNSDVSICERMNCRRVLDSDDGASSIGGTSSLARNNGRRRLLSILKRAAC